MCVCAYPYFIIIFETKFFTHFFHTTTTNVLQTTVSPYHTLPTYFTIYMQKWIKNTALFSDPKKCDQKMTI